MFRRGRFDDPQYELLRDRHLTGPNVVPVFFLPVNDSKNHLRHDFATFVSSPSYVLHSNLGIRRICKFERWGILDY